MWSTEYSFCKKCMTTEHPHKAQGLCVRCYAKRTERKHRFVTPHKKGESTKMLDCDTLHRLYNIENKSMSEIAKIANCSRQYINKLMGQLGIEKRDKKAAREIALKEGKIIRYDGATLTHVHVNEKFFSNWSPYMAYVLGLIYTDGCMYKQCDGFNRVSLSQKEPEILEKTLIMMQCNAVLQPRKNGDNILYTISVVSPQIYSDLLKIGLTPKKSLTLQYPNIPEEYEWHFIRGLWDGDGTIYKNIDAYVAGFVCGSSEFIIKLRERLIHYGIQPTKLYKHKANHSYFRVAKKQCLIRMRRLMYEETTELMYLKRKHDKFFAII